jgi:hypothetical protein
MKGRIIIDDVENPKEGMRVIWFGHLYTVCGEGVDKNTCYLTYYDHAVNIKELKQLFIEYHHEQLIHTYDGRLVDDMGFRRTLPIDPSDCTWASLHIQEEVDFTINDDCLGIEKQESKGSWSRNILRGDWAKIIIPETETWDDIINMGLRDSHEKGTTLNEFLEQNYHIPKKKTQC